MVGVKIYRTVDLQVQGNPYRHMGKMDGINTYTGLHGKSVQSPCESQTYRINMKANIYMYNPTSAKYKNKSHWHIFDLFRFMPWSVDQSLSPKISMSEVLL